MLFELRESPPHNVKTFFRGEKQVSVSLRPRKIPCVIVLVLILVGFYVYISVKDKMTINWVKKVDTVVYYHT